MPLQNGMQGINTECVRRPRRFKQIVSVDEKRQLCRQKGVPTAHYLHMLCILQDMPFTEMN